VLVVAVDQVSGGHNARKAPGIPSPDRVRACSMGSVNLLAAPDLLLTQARPDLGERLLSTDLRAGEYSGLR
jgi:hypothetical protein